MPNAASDARQVHNRRAVGFLVMSALLPGSVQRFAGNRRIGALALRTWGAVVALVVIVGLAAWLAPGPTVSVLLTPWVTVLAKVLLWGLFAGWLLLLLDAWRLARPMDMPRRHRLAMTLGVGLLAITVGFTTGYIANAFTAAGTVGEVLPGGGDVEEKAGRYNVLLLGLDSADDRIGIRPDSINVASVDAETGRTVLFGLPRNMQGVPFAEDSPMREPFPDGFRCPENECMLNAVWTAGEAHAALFPEGVDPGLQATKDAVGATLGLELNYYAMVDMNGFSSIIDAMGGIEMDVMKRIPIGGGGSPVSGYIEPGEGVLLDGRNALWFARSRHQSSDYERMQRQKCVLAAMANQLDPMVVATRFVELSRAGKDLLRTDVGRGEVVELAELALRGRNLDIASVNFMPPLIPNTADPDFALIRDTVAQHIADAERADEQLPTASPSAAASQSEYPSAAAAPTSASPVDTETGSKAEPSESGTASTASTAEGDPSAYVEETETDALAVVCSAA
ncbi:LCP family protein [Tessaracoccus oleiagri]|uniref:Transcriptional attenuator, LytR family n=1 Tax=Tessaracoccus oleiagri TaxID=686624 RepID=A0A1G9JIQ6_9ACTN|nr:LCP family protein [Tessaracoccus oleiagri]SDL37480.1 transcriptional attenuator, LytR family [Tessaracoccus oleiagri]